MKQINYSSLFCAMYKCKVNIYYRGIAADIRKVLGRNIIEPGLKAALVVKNHVLEDLFEVKVKEMKGKRDKMTGEIPDIVKTGVSNTCIYLICVTHYEVDILLEFVFVIILVILIKCCFINLNIKNFSSQVSCKDGEALDELIRMIIQQRGYDPYRVILFIQKIFPTCQ